MDLSTYSLKRLLGIVIAAGATILFVMHLWSIRPIAPKDEFTFYLNPPGGATWLEECVREERVSRDVTNSVTRERLTVAKDGAGYKISINLVTRSVTRNGVDTSEEEAAYWRIIKNHALIVALDKNGRATNVSMHDPEKYLSNARTVLQGKIPQKKLDSLPKWHKDNCTRSKEQWNEVFPWLTNRSASIGDIWTRKQAVNMYPDKMDVTTKIEFVERVKVGEVDCIRVAYQHTADAKCVKKLTDKVYKSWKRKSPGLKMLKTEVKGGGELLIDPETMLLYGTARYRYTIIEARSKGKKKTGFVYKEKETNTFDYQASPSQTDKPAKGQ